MLLHITDIMPRLPTNFKHAFKAFIVSPICAAYQVCSVRCKVTDKILVWERRTAIESRLKADTRVVAFVAALGTLRAEKKRKNRRGNDNLDEEAELDFDNVEQDSDEMEEGEGGNVGDELPDIALTLSFWIVSDSSELSSKDFEKDVLKILVEENFEVNQCGIIKGRGMFLHLYHCTKFQIIQFALCQIISDSEIIFTGLSLNQI